MNRKQLAALVHRMRVDKYFNNDPAAGLSLLAELSANLRISLPFCHIRYGDGTFHCIMQTRQQNSDGVLLQRALGAELLQVLQETARHSITDRGIHVGGIWSQRVRNFLRENDLLDSVPWYSANAFYDGLAGLQTKEFIELLAASRRPKVLIGPERIAPAARYLGAEHIVVPLKSAWENSGEIWPRVEIACSRLHVIAIFAAGMVSDTWGWRVYRDHPAGNATVIDIGHTFDACLGIKNRAYMQDDYFDHTLRDIVLREYSPLFDEFR